METYVSFKVPTCSSKPDIGMEVCFETLDQFTHMDIRPQDTCPEPLASHWGLSSMARVPVIFPFFEVHVLLYGWFYFHFYSNIYFIYFLYFVPAFSL